MKCFMLHDFSLSPIYKAGPVSASLIISCKLCENYFYFYGLIFGKEHFFIKDLMRLFDKSQVAVDYNLICCIHLRLFFIYVYV